jgi:hypothetical protein
MAACNFEFYFTYVLPGWEGSAADNTVYDDSLSRDFHTPPGKYYLGDAGYGLRSRYVARAVRSERGTFF